MTTVELDEARAQAGQSNHAALVRLARWADTFPDGDAFYRALDLSVLPRLETAEAFDRARAYFATGRHGLAHHEIAVILGTVRFTPGQVVRAESWGACFSCGGRDLVFAYPDPDDPDGHAMVHCLNEVGHVSGRLTFGRAWTALKGGAK